MSRLYSGAGGFFPVPREKGGGITPMNGHIRDEPPIAGREDSQLLHLLTCPLCRTWAIGRLLDRSAEEPDETLAAYDEVFERQMALAPELIEQARSQRAEAERLFDEILRTPRGRRLQKIRHRRFRSPDLLDLLLESSHAQQIADPRRAGDLAELAVRLATWIDEDEELAQSALVRALCLSLNACRLRGDWKGAEALAGRPTPFLAAPLDRAFYCRAVALLRWEQERTDEAAALLHHAARLYVLEGLGDEEGTCLALLGLLHAEGPSLGTALSLLYEGWTGMDRDLRPQLAVRAGLALACLLAEARQEERARNALREVWRLSSRETDPAELLRVHWHEARVLARLGDREEARPLLEGVFRKLIEEGSFAESALAAIDLAVVLAESGRAGEIGALVGDLESAFAGASALDPLRSAISGLAERAKRHEPHLRDAAGATASMLLRTLRATGLRLRPIPFA